VPLPEAYCAVDASVAVSGHQVRYVTGHTAYIEELQGERGVGQSWREEGRVSSVEHGDENASELRIKTDPQTENPGVTLGNGWHWESATKLPEAGRGSLHFVVELSHWILPIKVET
jgi:hypothetical protein